MGKEMDILRGIKEVSGEFIFERFADQLAAYTESGTLPLAGKDVTDSLLLQAERLKKMNLELHYWLKRQRYEMESFSIKQNWEDAQHYNELYSYPYLQKITVVDSGKAVYRRLKSRLLYETITSVKGGIEDMKEERPRPEVTNYYFLADVTGSQREIGDESQRYATACGIIVGIFIFVKCLEVGPLFASAFWGIMMGLVCSVPVGYTVHAVSRFIRFLIKSFRVHVTRREAAQNEKKFLHIIKEKNPQLSLPYFTGKVVFLLRMILFAENPEALSFYSGKPIPEAARLIDTAYEGVMEFRDCGKEEDVISVTVDISMKNLYHLEKKVQEKRNRFRMELCLKPENSDWVVNSCILIK